jgi:hypothetical protein
VQIYSIQAQRDLKGGYTIIYLKSCLGALNKALDPKLAIKVGINESSGQEPVPKDKKI